MPLEQLRDNDMMAHLLDSLAAGQEIGHYGRLVFAMTARSFIPEDEIVALLSQDPDCSEEKARALVRQVQSRNYNPPKRERILEWMEKQEFLICPDAQTPGACNVYRDLDFPPELYERISSYYTG